MNKKLLGTFKATGYNLDGCGKLPSHPAYGITANGFNLSGMSREDAMTVAVDPKIIKLGSKVYLEFEEEYKHLNGVYTARDTGGKWIQGKEIDVFMGVKSDPYTEIGKRNIKVYKIVE